MDPDGEPIPLPKHLDDVADRVDILIPEHARTPAGGSLRDLTRRIALVHDFGKLTCWFRQHLLNEGEPEGPKHHAPLGAFVAHYVLSASGFEDVDPLVGFLAVAKHHGRLPDTAEYVALATAEQNRGTLPRLFRAETFEQVDHIDETNPEMADELIVRATDGCGSWEQFRERMDDARKRRQHTAVAEHVCRGEFLEQQDPSRLPSGFYAGVLQAWSALVFADKTSATSLTTGIDLGTDAYRATVPDRTKVDNHVGTLQSAAAETDLNERTLRLNEQRETARQTARKRAELFAASQRSVATLTLPTGLGKTLTGLDAALTVLEEQDGNGRIIYALPFTSIVDQVAAESREVFGVNGYNDMLTVDHHLSETLVTPDVRSEEIPDDEWEHISALLGESWRSGLVVTTFVQLFESLAGPRNGQSMKLPALYDSVIVLDEPQALPLEWWSLAERLIELVTDSYDASVVSMTATQPRLFTSGETEPFSIIENPDPYFESVNRLRFELHSSIESVLESADPDPVAYDVAAERLRERLGHGSSVLSICNTIDSTRALTQKLLAYGDVTNVNRLYGKLLSELDNENTPLDPDTTIRAAVSEGGSSEPLVVHLTTRHRPCDRRHLIDVASQLTADDHPVALVSTQLVEAGVDVSFDEVFRDFAPLDSLVQAAGRCNRSFDRDRGLVTVWLLAPPEGRDYPPSSAVYGRSGESLTKVTAIALSDVYDGEPLSESVVTRDAVEAYFQELDERGVGTTEYVKYVDRANAKQLGRLSLIDQHRAVDVIVARTRSEWADLQRCGDLYEQNRWDELDNLLGEMADQQVSVPLYPSDDPDEKLVHLTPVTPGAERLMLDGRPDRHDGYFNPTIGFVIPDSSVEARFL